ncbi:MAG: FtsK/SpoIIIE domain-containing protein, partial [Ferrimicrobium sp.]
GLRKWSRDLGPLLFLIIDELPVLLNDPDKGAAKEFGVILQNIIAVGRAAGTVVVLAAQKPSADAVPTVTRDLIDYRLAFRSTTRDASDIILGSGQATLGFSASDIDPSLRGVAYLRGEGPEPRLVRCYYLDDASIASRLQRAKLFREEP